MGREARARVERIKVRDQKIKRLLINLPFAALIFCFGVLILMCYFAYHAYHEGPKKFFKWFFSDGTNQGQQDRSSRRN